MLVRCLNGDVLATFQEENKHCSEAKIMLPIGKNVDMEDEVWHRQIMEITEETFGNEATYEIKRDSDSEATTVTLMIYQKKGSDNTFDMKAPMKKTNMWFGVYQLRKKRSNGLCDSVMLCNYLLQPSCS
jgi:hypothetical protein